MNAKRGSPGLLAAGAVAAVLASTCCLGPLLLVLLGFSGAWIGSLSALEPFRPWFLGFTAVVLAIAAVRLFRPVRACDDCALCSVPRPRRLQQVCFCAVALLALVGLVFPSVAHFFY